MYTHCKIRISMHCGWLELLIIKLECDLYDRETRVPALNYRSDVSQWQNVSPLVVTSWLFHQLTSLAIIEYVDVNLTSTTSITLMVLVHMLHKYERQASSQYTCLKLTIAGGDGNLMQSFEINILMVIWWNCRIRWSTTF